jgi:hypothetical protein
MKVSSEATYLFQETVLSCFEHKLSVIVVGGVWSAYVHGMDVL